MKRKAKAHSESGWAVKMHPRSERPYFSQSFQGRDCGVIMEVFADKKDAQNTADSWNNIETIARVVRVRVTEQSRARKGAKR